MKKELIERLAEISTKAQTIEQLERVMKLAKILLTDSEYNAFLARSTTLSHKK